jgi:hypothetical protein
MKQFIVKHSTAFTGLAFSLLLGIILMSFQDSPLMHQKFDPQQEYDDTIPEKDKCDHMKMKDLEKLMSDLDGKIRLEVGDALKSIDLDKIQKDVELSLKAVDMQKIMKDVELTLKSIDLDKMMADVRSSLKDVDWDKHKVEIDQAMKEARVEIEKAKEEIKNIDMKEIHKELEEAKLEIEKARSELKKNKEQ